MHTHNYTDHRPRRGLARRFSASVIAAGLLLLFPAGAWAAASTSAGGGGDFLGIAEGIQSQGAAIAKIIGALLLIGTIFLGWVQNNLKIVGLGLIMALLAAFAVSGKLWTAGQGTADSITGAGQIQQRP